MIEVIQGDLAGSGQEHPSHEESRREGFVAGYEKAIKDVVFHLRYRDWPEDTAADAVDAWFSRHPAVTSLPVSPGHKNEASSG